MVFSNKILIPNNWKLIPKTLIATDSCNYSLGTSLLYLCMKTKEPKAHTNQKNPQQIKIWSTSKVNTIVVMGRLNTRGLYTKNKLTYTNAKKIPRDFTMFNFSKFNLICSWSEHLKEHAFPESKYPKSIFIFSDNYKKHLLCSI